MTIAPTIWNNTATPNAITAGAATANSTAGANSTDPSTISGNDFLTLLVTEMKNQDPTSASDPNQYINQLVSVNSLEQLIQINETLQAGLALSQPTNQSTSASRGTSGASQGLGAIPAASSAASHYARFGDSHFPPAVAQGNLGTPAANPAAQRVAQALSGAHL
ncbi:MAG TPA: flagellar hook capping FlgD N-terminal domain-containing protein [Terracidiphilus sp.]|jgi:flagellar basal-body rod modification protein FlgD